MPLRSLVHGLVAFALLSVPLLAAAPAASAETLVCTFSKCPEKGNIVCIMKQGIDPVCVPDPCYTTACFAQAPPVDGECTERVAFPPIGAFVTCRVGEKTVSRGVALCQWCLPMGWITCTQALDGSVECNEGFLS